MVQVARKWKLQRRRPGLYGGVYCPQHCIPSLAARIFQLVREDSWCQAGRLISQPGEESLAVP